MSIYKRKSGRYAVQITLDRGPDGKPRALNVGTFATMREAQVEERAAKTARDNGHDLSPRTMTVAELLARYLSDSTSRCGAKTLERYEEIVDQYLTPHVGAIVLAKLRPAHVSALCATLLERGGEKGRPLSAKTVHHAYALLKGALIWAVRMQLIAINPAAAVKPPHVVRARVRAFTADEVARLLGAAEDSRWLPLLQFALASGARRGEIAALRWEAVDFNKALVSIHAALGETRAGVALKSTKTERARLVPLSQLAADALRRQRAQQAREKLAAGGSFADRGFVFTGPFGGMIKPSVLTEVFRDLAVKAGLPITSLHALRHTAATWMLAGGVDVRSAAGILGHSTASTTLGIYAHAIASVQVSAVETIDARLKMAREGK